MHSVWRVCQQVQLTNKYVYHLPPSCGLPLPGWRNGLFASGGPKL